MSKLRLSTLRGRALAVVLLVLVIPAVVSLASCSDPKSAGAELWYCPMHPTYTSDRPGSCPICNMDLVQQEAATAEALPPGGEGSAILYYRSPMDPTVTSPVPAEDSMGMDFVPVYANEQEPPSSRDGAAAGWATVTLAEQGVRLAGVRTEPAVRETLLRSFRTVGRVVVDERRLHRAQTRVGGWVEKLYVDFEGRPVWKGQPMLAIYSPELLATQEEYLAARVRSFRFLASSIPEVRRGADDLILAARRRLELFDVPEKFIEQLERTGRPMRSLDLLAPATGFVVDKQVISGMRVEPGMELFTVADLTRIWVEADFYESEAAYAVPGSRARLTLPYDPTFEREVRIDYVYPRLNAEARTLRVRYVLDNRDLKLKPGMYVDVEVGVALPPGIVVADSAVIDTGLRQVLFVASGDGRFEPRVVHVLARANGRALLAEGPVEAGELVAVKANFLLDSESRLRAAIQAAAAGSGAAAAPPAAPGHVHDEGRP